MQELGKIWEKYTARANRPYGIHNRVFVEFYYFRFLSVKFMINTHSHTHIHTLFQTAHYWIFTRTHTVSSPLEYKFLDVRIFFFIPALRTHQTHSRRTWTNMYDVNEQMSTVGNQVSWADCQTLCFQLYHSPAMLALSKLFIWTLVFSLKNVCGGLFLPCREIVTV